MLVQGDRDVKCPPEDYFPRQTFLWQIKETLADTNIANQQQTPPAPAPANIELKLNKPNIQFYNSPPSSPSSPQHFIYLLIVDELYQGTRRCFYTLDESLWSKSGEDERKLVIFQIVELTVPDRAVAATSVGNVIRAPQKTILVCVCLIDWITSSQRWGLKFTPYGTQSPLLERIFLEKITN